MAQRGPHRSDHESHLRGVTAMHGAIPAGVIARHGASLLSPVQVPDLIGIRGANTWTGPALFAIAALAI